MIIAIKSRRNITINAAINPGYRTDHSIISLNLKLSDKERGPGYWKFNTSLLRDRDYVQLAKNTLNETSNPV